MLRVVFGAGWAVLATLVVYAAIGRPAVRRPDPPAARGAVAPSATGPIRLDQPVPWTFPGWTVVQQISVDHVLVVDIETARLQDARAIASQIVSPLAPRYDEILIYFHRPGTYARRDTPARRVQWTPERGYIETRYDGR